MLGAFICFHLVNRNPWEVLFASANWSLFFSFCLSSESKTISCSSTENEQIHQYKMCLFKEINHVFMCKKWLRKRKIWRILLIWFSKNFIFFSKMFLLICSSSSDPPLFCVSIHVIVCMNQTSGTKTKKKKNTFIFA